MLIFYRLHEIGAGGYFLVHVSWLRWTQWINNQPKSGLQHLRKQFLKEATAAFQTWVWIDFNKVWFKVIVKHKIVAKKLKCVYSFGHVKKIGGCSYTVCYYFLDLRKQFFLEVNFQMSIFFIKIFLKVRVA